MSRIHVFSLVAAVITLLVAAGCVSTSGPSPLMTPTPVQAPDSGLPAAAGTIPPAAAGTQAAGTCTADTQSDPANCGGCGYACPANALCQQGQCYCREGYTVENNGCVPAPTGTGSGTTGNGCPSGMSPCPDGYCYELAYDAANCGLCGNQCPAGMICSASTCTNMPAESTTAVPTTTAAVTTTVTTTTTSTGSSGLGPVVTGMVANKCLFLGLASCGKDCVNLQTNTTHCGDCDTVCKSNFPSCCNGKCVNYKTDPNNCGSCGHACISPATCSLGSCKSLSVIGSGVYKVPTTVPKINPSLLIQDPMYKQPGL